MKLWTRLGLLAAVAGSMASMAQDNDINWLDYREGLRVARETHKPLFVEFRCEA
jgi:hypothetical protein